MSHADEETVRDARIGVVQSIHVSSGTGRDPESRESVAAVAGRGIEGDRCYREEGIYNEQEGLDPSDVTLIEREALSAAREEYGVEFGPGEHRWNVTTCGVALNHLVGQRFRVGDTVFEGTGSEHYS